MCCLLVRGKGGKDNSATVWVSNCLSSWVNGGRIQWCAESTRWRSENARGYSKEKCIECLNLKLHKNNEFHPNVMVSAPSRRKESQVHSVFKLDFYMPKLHRSNQLCINTLIVVIIWEANYPWKPMDFWYKWTYLQNRKRLTDLENELTVTWREAWGEGLGSWGWTCTDCSI